MARTEFKVIGAPQKVSKTKAVEIARANQNRRERFNIDAPKGTVVTFTGDIYSQSWENGANKGDSLQYEAEYGGKKIKVAEGLLRSTSMLSETGMVDIEGIFSASESCVNIVNEIKGKQGRVAHTQFVFPGRSTAITIQRIAPIASESEDESEG